MIHNKIVDLALLDEGKKELRGNSGFVDKDFETVMKTTGWLKGQSWCAYWGEKIWVEAFGPSYEKALRSLFSANAVQTFNNFWNSNFITSDEPVLGALVIWQKVKDGQACFVGDTKWISGHLGIVTNLDNYPNIFGTHEGNSNGRGGREGIEVAKLNTRSIDAFETENGLKLLGFVHPKLKNDEV